MVLPISEFTLSEELEVISESELPTRTYKIDFERGRCVGMVDGLEAMEQAIYKRMSTVRFEQLIYSSDYGFDNPIGKDEIFVRAELPRRIRETLLQDERITSVVDFEMQFHKDEASVQFTCITLYGEINIMQEVRKLV